MTRHNCAHIVDRLEPGRGGVIPTHIKSSKESALLVLAIFGPTASGKSAVAEAVAARLGGEIVSADAMQVYRDLPILTNQSPARLIGFWPLDHEASVGEYARLAHASDRRDSRGRPNTDRRRWHRSLFASGLGRDRAAAGPRAGRSRALAERPTTSSGPSERMRSWLSAIPLRPRPCTPTIGAASSGRSS